MHGSLGDRLAAAGHHPAEKGGQAGMWDCQKCVSEHVLVSRREPRASQQQGNLQELSLGTTAGPPGRGTPNTRGALKQGNSLHEHTKAAHSPVCLLSHSYSQKSLLSTSTRKKPGN